jgi:arylsulfatase A-like enzyme
MMIGYIEKRGEKKQQGDEEPFFAVLSVEPPHDPYMAPERNMKNHNAGSIVFRQNVPDVKWVRDQASRDIAGYYAQIENIDENVGRLVEALRKNNLLFDTHIVFFSDHGDMHGSHGTFKKTSPYEESMRVPFIIAGETPMFYNRRGCGKIPGVLINHVDIAPTSLGLCGIKAPDWMEGVDYSHYRMRDNPAYDEPDSAYLQSVIPTLHGDSVDKAWRGILTKDGYKYICFENHEWLLFNLREDPYEQVNLCNNSKYWGIMRELNEKLCNWIEKTGDSFNLPVIQKSTTSP